jgi:hypothetical protein
MDLQAKTVPEQVCELGMLGSAERPITEPDRCRHQAGLLEPGGIVTEVIMNGVRGRRPDGG